MGHVVIAFMRAAAGCLGLFLAGCAPMTAPSRDAVVESPVGPVWLAEDIGGGGIVDRSHLTLSLDDNGKASGSTWCNQYSGLYRLRGDGLTITQVASTERACASALMAQEQRFLAMLGRVSNWRIERTGALVLLTKDGASLRFFHKEAARPAR